MISRVVVPAYNPTNNGEVFLFLHILVNNLLSPEFLILTILTGVRWILRVVLICISLMTKDVEHFFRCFSAIQDSFVENSLLSSVPHFLIRLFGLLVSNFLSSAKDQPQLGEGSEEGECSPPTKKMTKSQIMGTS